MTVTARKLVLPKLVVTEVVEETDHGASRVKTLKVDYFVRTKMVPSANGGRDGKSKLKPLQFNLYPLILRRDGSLWAEANMWIFSIIEGQVMPNIGSFDGIARDLSSFLEFIEEEVINWLSFPSQKLYRPTYRFNARLEFMIQNQEIGQNTAKRTMAVVIRFYRWLINEGLLKPENPPWEQSDHFVGFKGRHGESRVKKIVTTDVSIKVSLDEDPYDEHINDGGKLRPLPQIEQEWVMDALMSLGNTEMTLIHLFGLLTGARIQTILTHKVRHVKKETRLKPHEFIRYPIGPGTGIDTKFNKKIVLFVPVWFYEMLHTYAASERAIKRRLKAFGGDTDDQYLFLSIRGTPLYTARSQQSHEETNSLRHRKVGQGVRQYMTEYILPFIKKKYDANFHYQFHDTRATYGMNMVDKGVSLVEAKKITLKELMDFLRTRLGQVSFNITEKYLNYRSRLKLAHSVQDSWEAKLEQMARSALAKNNG